MGVEYMGHNNISIKGLPCQRWDQQYPHSHTRVDPEYFPDPHLYDAHNYCRNPDGEPGGPWCYTTDQRHRWQYCEIPLCSKYIVIM